MTDTRIGIDVGGTFTDVVVAADGDVVTRKVPTTPSAPSEGVVIGARRALDAAGAGAEDVVAVDHGTTVATNAVLEGDWAETALVTTEGFRDVLAIGRQTRPALYALDGTRPAPVVPRHRRFGVTERRDHRGETVEPLDEDGVAAVADGIDGEVDAVAVSFLFSYEDAGHEQRARALLEDRLDVPVAVSHETLPRQREYERTLATAVDAALRPVVEDELAALERRLAALGVDAPLHVMQSNGGSATADRVATHPVRALTSGPAAGVRGAAHVAALAGHDDCVTMDMGGTSCDVAVVTDGTPVMADVTSVGDRDVPVPAVDLHTIGSGGGSVARIDGGGALRVGPESAGARPGPVCYGRGGEEPTVTDAHAILGRIAPSDVVEEPAAPDVVEAAFEELCDALDAGPRAVGRDVLAVAAADTERALRVVTVERGRDPAELPLVAFGGAGPLHAAGVAERLGVPRVLVPRAAGVLSAVGLLASDRRHDHSVTRVRDWSAVTGDWLASEIRALAEETPEDPSDETVAVEPALDLRYRGQAHELTVEASRRPEPEAVAQRFHATHEQRYGASYADEPLELVTVRLAVRVPTEPPQLEPAGDAGDPDDAVVDERPVGFPDGDRDTRVYDRERLGAEASLDGPAIVAGAGSTAVVPPGWRARVDDHGTLAMEGP